MTKQGVSNSVAENELLGMGLDALAEKIRTLQRIETDPDNKREYGNQIREILKLKSKYE